jgi:hypothetical protein
VTVRVSRSETLTVLILYPLHGRLLNSPSVVRLEMPPNRSTTGFNVLVIDHNGIGVSNASVQ